MGLGQAYAALLGGGGGCDRCQEDLNGCNGMHRIACSLLLVSMIYCALYVDMQHVADFVLLCQNRWWEHPVLVELANPPATPIYQLAHARIL